jgi:hypothetical protein
MVRDRLAAADQLSTKWMESRKKGDNDGADVWLRIIVAIGAAVRLRASLDWLGALETPR